MCVLGAYRDQKRVSSPGTGDGYKLACGNWKLNLGLLHELKQLVAP